jgi:hypothetical protein
VPKIPQDDGVAQKHDILAMYAYTHAHVCIHTHNQNKHLYMAHTNTSI